MRLPRSLGRSMRNEGVSDPFFPPQEGVSDPFSHRKRESPVPPEIPLATIPLAQRMTYSESRRNVPSLPRHSAQHFSTQHFLEDPDVPSPTPGHLDFMSTLVFCTCHSSLLLDPNLLLQTDMYVEDTSVHQNAFSVVAAAIFTAPRKIT